MILSSVPQSEIKFHTDITDCVTDGFVTSFFCLKREICGSSVDIRVKSVSMILSSVPQPEITFHTDYHGVGYGWICYELFCLKREIRDSSIDIRVKSVSMIRSLIICRDDTSMREK